MTDGSVMRQQALNPPTTTHAARGEEQGPRVKRALPRETAHARLYLYTQLDDERHLERGVDVHGRVRNEESRETQKERGQRQRGTDTRTIIAWPYGAP